MKKLILTVLLTFGAALPAQAQILDNLPEFDVPGFIDKLEDNVEKAIDNAKDYSNLPPKAEREARLKDLFRKLKKEDDAETANLIAEEVWALWLDSGSASVNFVVRRAISADKNGDKELARRLYDQVTVLAPDYAEGWSRSGRLAFNEEDYNRAVIETTKALIIEPRHFYALWTMGNLLENLEKQDEALAAYKKAHDIYPALPIIKDRIETLEGYVSGAVL